MITCADMDRLTTKEVALILGDVSTGRVRQLVKAKLLKPSGKIGQTYTFTRKAVDRYLEKKRNGR